MCHRTLKKGLSLLIGNIEIVLARCQNKEDNLLEKGGVL
jgi:hypothetical protein